MDEEIKKAEEIKNNETVKQEIKQEETKVETKKKTLPKLFFDTEAKIEVSVDGYHNNETGELVFVLPSDDTSEETFTELFTRVIYKFWFTRVSYDKLNRYRTRSMIYNSEDQNNTINELRLREFFLVYHLVDWNLTDESGNKIEMKFDPNKALSDQTLKTIYQLPPNLIDSVLNIYEKKMSLA